MKVTDFCNDNLIRLREFSLSKKSNQHTSCTIKLQHSEELEENIDFSKIYSVSDDNLNDIVMCGKIDNWCVDYGYSESLLSVTFHSLSRDLDQKRVTRIFQDTNKTLKDILDFVAKENNIDCSIIDNDKINLKIEKPIVQINETDFEFARRLAGSIDTVLWVDDKQKSKCQLLFGHDRGEEGTVFDLTDFTRIKRIEKGTISRYEVVFNKNSDKFKGIDIGKKIRYGGKFYTVVEFDIWMECAAFEYGAILERVQESKMTNEKAHKSYHFIGKVVDNKDKQNKGRVQVDFSYDDNVKDIVSRGENRIWIDVATPYAAKDSGIIFIPDVGDIVDVQLYDDEFLVTNVRRTKAIQAKFQNINDKYICDLQGRYIVFSKEYMEIVSKENKCHIDDNKIEIITNQSFIDIENEKIKIDSSKSSLEVNSNVDIKTKDFNVNSNGNGVINAKSATISATTVEINGSGGISLN